MRAPASLAAIAVLAVVAALSGSADGRSQPAQRTPGEVEKVAAQARRVPLGSAVRIDLTDGRRIEGVLIDVGDTEVRVVRPGQDRTAATAIALADIERIRRKKGTSPFVWVAVGVGIAILVPLALCAAA